MGELVDKLLQMAEELSASGEEKPPAVGNTAAMRDALERLSDKVCDYLQKGLIQLPLPIEDLLKEARAALALPPRQCDVGTAEEQAKRYGRYCDKFTSDGMHCETCPCCGKIPFGKCEFAWAQMPYAEEGGAK